ncbi:MAG: ABC transporter permease [Lachnospiraceae bacterium]|nr:ABC transporter permease [Lachnospiraceae bacterium]
MLLLENILMALSGLKANKMRSLLTMLGIIIGIASVIAINTVGNSMTSSIQSEFEEMGANNISIGVSQKSSSSETDEWGMTFNEGPHSTTMSDEDYLNDDILTDISEKWPEDIKGIMREASAGSGTVTINDDYAYVSVKGENDFGLDDAIDDDKLLSGRKFKNRDYTEARKVCIVSDYFCNNLYAGDTSAAIGQNVKVVISNKNYYFTIVGVYEYEDSEYSSTSEADTETSMYVPVDTAFDLLHKDSQYSEVTLATASGVNVDSFMEEVQDYINKRYYRNNESFEVSTFSMSSILESMTSQLTMMSLAISIIAGISLLVGGIGVMNIMLVSIQERTREIGTRKALGATNTSIRLQFIVESIVLCIVGGIIGMFLGLILGAVGSEKLGYAARASTGSIIFAIVFSMVIGVFFGYYPANKAAQMNPIDALRYE